MELDHYIIQEPSTNYTISKKINKLDMKTNKETVQRILKLNHLVVINHIKGNTKRKRFYQSLLNWVISKEMK